MNTPKFQKGQIIKLNHSAYPACTALVLDRPMLNMNNSSFLYDLLIEDTGQYISIGEMNMETV